MSEDQDPKQPKDTADQPSRPDSGSPAGPPSGPPSGPSGGPSGGSSAGPGPRQEGSPQYGDRRGPGGPPRGPGGPPRGGPGGPPRGGPGGPPRGGYGGPPRGGPGGRRDSPYPQRRFPRRFRRGKVCAFCVNKVDYIDYKALDTIRKFITDRGKILPRRITGNCARHQRMLCSSIQRARNIALIPFKVM